MDDEQRTPNQAANQEQAEGSRSTVDEASSSEERGHDPDLRPNRDEPVQAPDDIDATPPHGDKLQDH